MSSRREFLRQASAGMAGLGALRKAETVGSAASDPCGNKTARSRDRANIKQEMLRTRSRERRELIAEAHFGRKKKATSNRGMAICSHPLATREAVKVLAIGGNACDAALCASITQTVIEPHMTGITGALSMLYYDADSSETTYMNGSANVPLGASVGPKGVAAGPGVPGFWAGFEAALERYGTRSKQEVMGPAIRYARGGFEIHPFLWGEMFAQCHLLGATEAGRKIFMPENALPRPGDLLVQQEAADTLERLAEEGNDYFYRGEFAEEYCRVAQSGRRHLTLDDFAHYEARWQKPAWGTYHEYKIVGAPPPDSGGAYFIEILNLLEFIDLPTNGLPSESPEVLEQVLRAIDMVLHESNGHGDPECYPVDLDKILSKEYAAMRFELMKMGNALPSTRPDDTHPGSNHVTVADGNGNVATILHTCNSLPWSNSLFVKGVTMCNVDATGMPGYRKSNYVLPNIIFKGDKPFLASGSPSISLIQNVLQNSLNLMGAGIPIDESVHRPRFGSHSFSSTGFSNRILIEPDFSPDVVAEVESRGIGFDRVNPWNWHNGAFEGIQFGPEPETMVACGDPRRNSKAEGL